jgi:glycosyltransferase involved in cell wall biosynthesis
VAVSSEIREELLALGISPASIRHIPNGVDTGRFRPADAGRRARARRGLGLPTDGAVVAFVGVMNPRKNVGAILDGWERWRRSRSGGATLVLAGPASGDPSDPLRRRLESLSATAESGVRWLGPLEEVTDVYAASDLFVLPSKGEGMANVVLEAMASGIPCAVAEGSGSRDLLGARDDAGWILEGPPEIALARVFDLLVSSPDRVSSMGETARRRAEAEFSFGSVASAYVALYRELAAEGRRSAGG